MLATPAGAANRPMMTYVRPDITLLPHLIEDEKLVIGCLLPDNEAWNAVCELITAVLKISSDQKVLERDLLKRDLPLTVPCL